MACRIRGELDRDHQFAIDWSTRPIIMGSVLLLRPFVDRIPFDTVLR